jgi:hypothetical protein
MQVEASNHLKLLQSKAVVVSVKEKASKTCQVNAKETNTREPLIKYRKRRNAIKTRGVSLIWEESGRNLSTDQTVTGMKAA